MEAAILSIFIVIKCDIRQQFNILFCMTLKPNRSVQTNFILHTIHNYKRINVSHN